MSFWSSNVGSVSGDPKDAFVKTFENIPDGSKLLARIKSIEVVDGNNGKFIEVTWQVKGSEFDGQQVRQKIKCWDDDSTKRHKALNMFMLLHKLFNIQPSDYEPDRAFLMKFINKGAGIKVQLTKPMPETGNRYNWVSEVHSHQSFETYVPEVQEEVVEVKPKTSYLGVNEPQNLDDDIPF